MKFITLLLFILAIEKELLINQLGIITVVSIIAITVKARARKDFV